MPDHTATIRPATSRYRVYLGDELLLETDQVLEVQERLGERVFPIVAYIAPGSVTLELGPSDTSSTCPLKGQAEYRSFRDIADAVWTYPHPKDTVAEIAGHFGFDTSKGFRVERAE